MIRRSALKFSPGAAGPVLAEDDAPLAWQDLAACQYTDPDLFFPEEDGDADAIADRSDQARRVCLGCPVRPQCLSFGLGSVQWGMWGGLSERELRRERLREEKRSVEEILADSDARYFARMDARIAAAARKAERETRQRADRAAPLRMLERAA